MKDNISNTTDKTNNQKNINISNKPYIFEIQAFTIKHHFNLHCYMKSENKVTFKDDGIILFALYYLFRFLNYLSFFGIIRLICDCLHRWAFRLRNPIITKQEYKIMRSWSNPFVYSSLFSEIWVIFNLILSIVTSLIIRNYSDQSIGKILCFYAAWRSFDIFVYQVNVLLFDPIKVGIKQYRIKSATRMILMLFINFVEYTFWFSSIYIFFKDDSYRNILNESFKILANITSGDFFEGNLLFVVAKIETFFGIFINLVCLARFLSMLPPVKSQNNN